MEVGSPNRLVCRAYRGSDRGRCLAATQLECTVADSVGEDERCGAALHSTRASDRLWADDRIEQRATRREGCGHVPERTAALKPGDRGVAGERGRIEADGCSTKAVRGDEGVIELPGDVRCAEATADADEEA